MKDTIKELGIVIVSVLLALMAARLTADALAGFGVPILSGSGSVVPLP